jgi:hypothetical protein
MEIRISGEAALLGRAATARGVPRWAILLLIAIAARAITFGDPIVHSDEEFYFVAARAWLGGALPYVGVWDRKPVGLFLIYLPAAALGYPAGIWAYQAMALASATATAALVARLADRAGWSRGALAAGAAYILWLDLLEGQGGQSPVFYNLLTAGAALLICPRADDANRPSQRLRRGAAALALVGLALQVKYSVVFEGLYFGLGWLWRERRLGADRGRMTGGAMLLVASAVAPTAAAWASYAALGHAREFLFADFLSIADRRTDPLAAQLANLAVIAAVLAPLLAGAALAWRQRRGTAEDVSRQTWLFGWALAALAGLIAVGTWFSHYALPALVPLAVCSAGFVARHRQGPKIAAAVLAVAFLGGQAMLALKQAYRGAPAQFGAVAKAVGTGPGCLYVYSGDSMLYAATDRCALSRYVFPSHLDRKREEGAVGVDQSVEAGRIMDRRPEVVVMRAPFPGERADVRALISRRLKQGYVLKEHVPYGRDWVEVYRLRRLETISDTLERRPLSHRHD